MTREISPQECDQLAELAEPLSRAVANAARRNARAVLDAIDELERVSDPEGRIAALATLYDLLRDQYPKETRNTLLSAIAAESLRPEYGRIPWPDVEAIARSAGSTLRRSHLRQSIGMLRGTLGTNGARARELDATLTRERLTRELSDGSSYAEIARDVGTSPHVVAKRAADLGLAHLNTHR